MCCGDTDFSLQQRSLISKRQTLISTFLGHLWHTWIKPTFQPHKELHLDQLTAPMPVCRANPNMLFFLMQNCTLKPMQRNLYFQCEAVWLPSLLYRTDHASAACSSPPSIHAHTQAMNPLLMTEGCARAVPTLQHWKNLTHIPAAYAKTCITSAGNPQSPLIS